MWTLSYFPLALVVGLCAADLSVFEPFKANCGKTRLQGGTIVGGEEAADGEFPWLVSLQLQKYEGYKPKHFCGAAILSDRWLLTASHCFEKIVRNGQIGLVSFVAGTTEPMEVENGERYELEKAILHPNYSQANFRDDICLLRTKKPIQLRKTDAAFSVNTICLPPYNTKKVSYPPAETVVAGWGTTASNNREGSAKLLKVSVNLVDHDKCAQEYINIQDLQMTNETLCYGQPNKDSCQGDSGGPLVKAVGPRTYTLGIVSFGAGCGVYPGVYTEVSKYLGWIGQNVY